MRIALAILLILSGVAAAWAISPSQQIILFGGNSSASSPPAPTGKILQVDGVSHILQVDGISKICIAGGC